MLCGAFPYLVRYSGAYQQNDVMRNARKYPYAVFGQRRPISACANAQDDQDFPCSLTESGYSSICTSGKWYYLTTRYPMTLAGVDSCITLLKKNPFREL